MKILALESSCDDTAAAIVEDGRRVLSNVIASQTELHAQFGGVLPEIAARQHLEAVNPCIAKALADANCTLDDIDAFAATLGPGLVGALLVGVTAAKSLSLMTGKPFLGVNHLFAHVASNYLESNLEPPFLCLLVSGGHTQLLHVKNYQTMVLLGETRDDAVGEAYDKVARLMRLPYPGGPNLDKLAKSVAEKYSKNEQFKLPKAQLENPVDFSFSGLKTACLRLWERELAPCNTDADKQILQERLAVSFQTTAVETLFEKTIRCAELHHLTSIAIAGGVSANSALRQKFKAFTEANPHYQLFIPQMAFCTDNAAMVAASAHFNPISTSREDEVFSRQQPLATTSPL